MARAGLLANRKGSGQRAEGRSGLAQGGQELVLGDPENCWDWSHHRRRLE